MTSADLDTATPNAPEVSFGGRTVEQIQRYLVDPYTEDVLHANGQILSGPGGNSFHCREGIVDLFLPSKLDEAIRLEMDSFDANPVFGVPYFTLCAYQEILAKVAECSGDAFKSGACFAEMGGGEGYLARHLKASNPQGNVFVCDISRRYLTLAPTDLFRICCDMRRPVFRPATLTGVFFWVSLHHLNFKDMTDALRQAYKALAPGGFLVIFEPNAAALPRVVLSWLLKHKFMKVYFDENETFLQPKEILKSCADIGFQLKDAVGYAPQYDKKFLEKLSLGRCSKISIISYNFLVRSGIFQAADVCLRLCGQPFRAGGYFLLVMQKPVSNI